MNTVAALTKLRDALADRLGAFRKAHPESDKTPWENFNSGLAAGMQESLSIVEAYLEYPPTISHTDVWAEERDYLLEKAAQQCSQEADRQAGFSNAAKEKGIKLAHSTAAWSCMEVAQRIRAMKRG